MANLWFSLEGSMAVLDMSPHTLYYQEVTDGYEDDNGDYHEGESKWVKLGKCDIVPAGKSNEKILPNGNGVIDTYSYTVYLSKDVREFKYGEKIRISIFNKEPKEFAVKGFHSYQLQAKLWI